MKKSHKSIQFFIILVLFVFTLMACADGGSGNGDEGGNDTGVETIRAGQWSGNAGFGEVEFEVTPDSTGIESFKVIFSDFTCGTITHGGSITLTFSPAEIINNRNIDIDITLGGFQSSDYISIEGIFEATGDYISGNFELDNGAAICSGSWDAQPI
jgi:hypothetical protein